MSLAKAGITGAVELTRPTLAAVALAVAGVLCLGAGPAPAATQIAVTHREFSLPVPNDVVRFETYCPRGMRPLGGGFRADPPVDPMGGGAFPLAYERLGAQNGWHIDGVNVNTAAKRNVTVQAFCATYKGPIKVIEKVLGFHLDSGQTKSVTAKCPGGTKIISGGYLSTDFSTPPPIGVYIHESRAATATSWRITATALGFGGDVNPIAYCRHSKKTLVKEVVSAPAAISAVGASTTTIASCPGGTQLSAGGWDASSGVLAGDTYRTDNGAWSTTGVGFTSGGQITGYAYCLAANLPTKGHKK